MAECRKRSRRVGLTDCVRDDGHRGDHEDFAGHTWTDDDGRVRPEEWIRRVLEDSRQRQREYSEHQLEALYAAILLGEDMTLFGRPARIRIEWIDERDQVDPVLPEYQRRLGYEMKARSLSGWPIQWVEAGRG